MCMQPIMLLQPKVEDVKLRLQLILVVQEGSSEYS